MRRRIEEGVPLGFTFESFAWDERKRTRNIAKHRVDFTYAKRVFEGSVFGLREMDGGEERWIVIGLIDGREFAVAFVESNGLCRIISARRAARHEREAFYEGVGQGGKPARRR